MAPPTDGEPAPRSAAEARRWTIDAQPFFALPRLIARPPTDFFDVLDSRRSAVGNDLSSEQLSPLLWHSMRLRERWPGRFGLGSESRSAPSAGGLHPTRLLVLPVDGAEAGIYDDHHHGLTSINVAAVELNRASIAEILGATNGTTIQFATDAALVATCYENPISLIWRDAGALLATICLVATALGLTASPVGRIGNTIVQTAGLPDHFIGTGAVHVGTLNGPAKTPVEDREVGEF